MILLKIELITAKEYKQLKKQLNKQSSKSAENNDNNSDRINITYEELESIIQTFRDLHNLSYSEILLIKDFCNNLKEGEDTLFLIQEDND